MHNFPGKPAHIWLSDSEEGTKICLQKQLLQMSVIH